jgi:GH15 family glucan-1,4-alpha-glucosidase
LCLPRFDSPAVFARILDERAGHWSIQPTTAFTTQRRYLPGTLAVETTFTTDGGVVRLVDAMAARDGQRGHDLGLDAPHEILRSVAGVEGRVELDRTGSPVFRAGVPHTRWRSGLLPPVHVAHLELISVPVDEDGHDR